MRTYQIHCHKLCLALVLTVSCGAGSSVFCLFFQFKPNGEDAELCVYCSDFPFVVAECGYKGAKEAVSLIANQISLSTSELEWIMGRTILQLFRNQWLP